MLPVLTFCTYYSSLELVLYQVSHLQTVDVYVGCRTFHSGLVYEVENAADIWLKFVAKKKKQ